MQSKAKGTVHGLSVSRHPKLPGYECLLLCDLTELDEATRVLSNVVGLSPAKVRTEMPVEVSIGNVDDELTLLPLRPAK